MFSEDKIKRLEKDLDKKLVLQRWDGMDYIPGFVAIEHLNAIFGYDGWSYQVNEIKRDGMFYYSVVKLEVFCDDKHETSICRSDVGIGKVEMTREKKDKQGNIIKKSEEMLEMAIKGSVTDALKRSARTIGKQFGLGLYDEKDQLSYITRELTDNEREIIKPFVNALQTCNDFEKLEKIGKELTEKKQEMNKRMIVYLAEIYKHTENELVEEEHRKELKNKGIEDK